LILPKSVSIVSLETTTPENIDYQEYLEWEAIDGNTIQEAD